MVGAGVEVGAGGEGATQSTEKKAIELPLTAIENANKAKNFTFRNSDILQFVVYIYKKIMFRTYELKYFNES